MHDWECISSECSLLLFLALDRQQCYSTPHPTSKLQKTGAGKTFTMCGDARNYHHRGIIPRTLHHIFREIDMRPDRIYR